MSSAAIALPAGELVLDRYRPLRPLGRGGSGSVWLARDEQTGLEVALKIVAREGKRAARAAREMEAASRLRHERCVRAYDFGGDGGHVYIVYEYVHGQTMREAIRSGKLTDRDAVEIAAQILDALAHAHRSGIVHRDVKPSNVLVEDKEIVSIRLLDFGLAQFDEADTLTAVGDVPGTLAYISPERLRGGEATEASDVWAVGVLLWESLAGEHPFWGVPLPEVAAAIEAGAAPITGKRPDLTRQLAVALDAALAIEPSRRPPAGRLAAKLRSALETPDRGRAVAPRPRPAPKPKLSAAPVPIGKRLAPAALAGIAALGAASLLPFWTPGLVLLLGLLAGGATLRSPRAGLAIVLFAPVFPLGNVAQAAAVAYGALATGWLVLCWRDARAGLLFVTGPLLAAVGGLALLPLAVLPARGALRRGAHAFAGVLTAALVAALRGSPLPLTGQTVGGLGLEGTTDVGAVVSSIAVVLQANPAVVSTAAALAASAVALPFALRHGLWGIASLGAGQIAVVLLAGPTVPAVSIVLGTWLLCGILVAVRVQGGRYP